MVNIYIEFSFKKNILSCIQEIQNQIFTYNFHFSQYEKKTSFYNTYLYFEKKYCIYYKYFCVAEFIFKNKKFLYFISYKLKILRSL